MDTDVDYDSDDSFSTAPESLLPEPSALLANELIEDLTAGTQDESPSSDTTSAAGNIDDGPPKIKPRPYQIEMFEESLRRNIIVAMDTGSGKTHVAIMRMIHELEKMPANQLIWFLAPTVSLCEQQFEKIEAALSSVHVKLLRGADGVDRWSEQSLWDAVLKNVKVVVCTYQILHDALSHGFVRMGSLALIVFDEAHNCVGKQSGAKLMTNFYHKRKSQGVNVPHILGLTASPVMRSDPKSLASIETTLDAICRTPTKHRQELRLQVKLPVLKQIYYQASPPESALQSYTKTIETLGQAYKSLNIRDDPFIISLIKEDSERSQRLLDKVLMNHKTYSHEQLKSFHATTLKICHEVGGWAADYYVSMVVSRVIRLADESRNDLGIWDVANAERQYIAQALRGVKTIRTTSHDLDISSVTNKVNTLIEELLREKNENPHFRGIIFVQERAVVSVLVHLLSIHPRTRDFKVATMVGTSAHNYRAHNVGELIDLDAQKDTLDQFRSGKINLVIATSVLEEGIDVPSCNVVYCFQKPANLKSFVQRRGRARQRDSKLILLLDSGKNKLVEFEQLEAEMKAMYEDEMRALQEALLLEDGEEQHELPYEIESTGALLDFDNAVAHLYHFCATLPAKEYVDLRPEFICDKNDAGLIRARVILPLSIDKAVRTAQSKKLWLSERNAYKDAAFQSYIALYKAHLVNDNLLPLLRQDSVTDELTATAIETRASIVAVSEQLNPWITVAQAWNNPDLVVRQSNITVGDMKVKMHLPVDLPPLPPLLLFWDGLTEILVYPENGSTVLASHEAQSKALEDTWCLLQAGFGSRFPIEKRRTILGLTTDYEKPFKELLGQRDLTNHLQLGESCGLIREKLVPHVAYIYKELLPFKPKIEEVQNPYSDYLNTPNCWHLAVKRLPKRGDFLHKIPIQNEQPTTTRAYSTVLPLKKCTVDDMPFRFVQFAMLIPSILHHIELTLVAKNLSDTLLKNVGISELSLIVTAITASSAGENTNYERLEFLGDSILKMCTSVQLMAEYPLWHEGYLSKMKDRLVANSRLSRASVDSGLDKFIITKKFTGHKWRPLYVDDLLNKKSNDKQRDMSTKTLADVVEALIGASMVDGGIPKALSCLQTFLPELQWQPLSQRRSFLYQRAPSMDLPSTLSPLQDLLGYKFNKPSLLVEALTHASCNTGFASLERFEFLGDSLLDNIIVTAMWTHSPPLNHFQMHILRTVLVNADFLAFISMDFCITQEIIDLELEHTRRVTDSPKVHKHSRKVEMPLYKFMKHTSPHLSAVQVATAKRFSLLRPKIKEVLEKGTQFPWALLAKLQAQKFYSDIVEAVIGAVWIDSGSMDVCTEVVEKMGILAYARRVLGEGVHVWHPKEELGVLADSERVMYLVERRGRGVEKVKEGEEGEEGGEKERGKEGEGDYICTIFVGGREVVRVEGGVDRVEVRTKAAEKAVEILSRERDGGERGAKEDEEMDVDEGGGVKLDGDVDVDAGGVKIGADADAETMDG